MGGAAVTTRFRLLSANLWNGRADPAAFAELIGELAPDVVAVQELSPEQADALATILPHGQLEPSRDFSGMGIALRRPAVVERLSLPCRDARVVEFWPGDGSTTEHSIEVINVHIAAPHLWPTHLAIAHRRGQLRGLEAYLDTCPERPRAMVGDFNSTPFWLLYRRLAHRLMDAAIEVAHRYGNVPAPTWGPWPGAPRLLRLDHVFVHGLVVENFQVLELVGGDHAALVVDLAVPLHET